MRAVADIRKGYADFHRYTLKKTCNFTAPCFAYLEHYNFFSVQYL